MIGDKIGEQTGKVVVRRVLSNPGGAPRTETTFEAAGKILGVEEREIGTYTSNLRPDGTIYGEGQGIIIGSGGEVLSWVGQGVGSLKKDGSVSYRGSLYYQTSAPAWSRLNHIVGVFEYEVDPHGATRAQIWEWK